MSQFLKGKEHLARMAGLFAVGITSFFVLRYVMVPAGFGLYGHYRPGALADNRLRTMSYAGRAICEQCHAEVVEARKGSKHAAIACEACHGPLARHAESPGEVAARRPDGRELCLHCHLANIARPVRFPQIQVPEHSDAGPCIACHKSHAPQIS